MCSHIFNTHIIRTFLFHVFHKIVIAESRGSNERFADSENRAPVNYSFVCRVQ